MQQLTAQVNTAGRAFGRLMRAHQTLRRELDAQLAERHQLSVSELEVLAILSRAEENAMKRVDLANEVQLSPSGITRMLDRLEAAEMVEKRACKTDARVTYAALTPTGLSELEAAMPLHHQALEQLMGDVLSDEEIDQLSSMLDRLAGGVTDEPCEVGEQD